MVLLESGFFDFFEEELKILLTRSYKIQGFQMSQFFSGILYFLNEIDIIFIEFGLGVDNRNNP